MTDYYSVLGLKKGASSDEVKKAYKTMAKKYHPDVSKEENAEVKFKEVLDAYQVLSDPEKKQNYDNYGDSYKNFQGYQQGFSGFGQGQRMDFDFEDIFNQFSGMDFDFGDIFGRRNRRTSQDFGSNVKLNVTLSFNEAAFGVTKEISYDRIKRCEKCNGMGAEGKLKKCPTCNGSGREVKQQRTPFGIFQTQTTCRHCKGKGNVAEKECKDCNGNGLITEKEKIDIKIPAGINTGNHLRLKNKGHEGKDGNGDLFIVIFIETHEVFKRNEADIYAEIPISFAEAALGTNVEVPTLNGKADLKIPSGTQTGTIFKMKGKGIQKLESSSFGDEYIKVIVETPKKLSKKEEELLEKLSKEEKISKDRKSFFKKIFGKF